MQKLVPGMDVLYALPAGTVREGEIRPAKIVQVWTQLDHPTDPGLVNLVVFKGQSDDFYPPVTPNPVNGHLPVQCGLISKETPDTAIALISSVHNAMGPKPGTWHLPGA